MAGWIDAVTYGMAQAARTGWFYAQYRAALQLTARLDPHEDAPPEAFPSASELWRDLRALLAADADNIRRGLYPRPRDLIVPPHIALSAAKDFFAELPSVHLRRRQHSHTDTPRDPASRRLPRYYQRNFHYQSDGYLSARSAALYDYQVETLFSGAADAMRRQCLVPVRRALGPSGAGKTLVDIASGTGRFLGIAAASFPEARMIGVDLSAPYLTYAAGQHRLKQRATLVQANGEALPLADNSADAVVSIFLFHELPKPAQRRVAAEMARIVKPGGVVVIMDSLQRGDKPAYDILLSRFPKAFHEPYYRDYTELDLPALFTRRGLSLIDQTPAFLAKRLTFIKPEEVPRGAT